MVRSIAMLTSRRATIVRITVALLLLASALAFARGWLYSDMHAKLPWAPGALLRVGGLSLAFWLAYVAIVASGRRALAAKLAAAALIAVAAVAGPLATFVTAAIFLAGCALGHGILSRNGRDVVEVTALPLCTALGLGMLGALLAAAGPFRVHGSLTYGVLLAAPLLWQGRRLAAVLRGPLFGSHSLSRGDLAMLGAIGNFVVLGLAMALLPEVGNDALAFHMLIAAHVRDFGAWHYDVQRNVLAVMPLAGTFLNGVGYMLAGELAARLVNAGALVVALALVFSAVRPVGSRSAALLATLVAASSPIAFLESASLFVDNAWAVFVLAGFVALLQFARGGDNVLLLAGGIGFGAALATKTISIAAVPGIVLLLALALKDRRSRFPWGWLAVASIAALLLALPSYVIAHLKTGNPVFPFLNTFFQSPYYPLRDMVAFPPSLDPLLGYRMTFYSDRYIEGMPGSHGFTTLLLGPAVLLGAVAWGGRTGVSMVLAALAFALVVVSNTAYLRYLYPAGFLLAIALGAALAGMPKDARRLQCAFVGAALVAVGANLLFLPAAWPPGRPFDLAPLVDARARDAFVDAWAARRRVITLLNALEEPGSGVAFIGGPPYLAELRRPGYLQSSYTRSFSLADLGSRDDLLALVRQRDIAYLVVDAGQQRDFGALVASIAAPIATLPASTIYRVEPGLRHPVK